MSKLDQLEMRDLSSYVSHVCHGHSIRSIARQVGKHPSTILRRVRRFEDRRDDPLFDRALDQLEVPQNPTQRTTTKGSDMKIDTTLSPMETSFPQKKELQRVLQRLCETGASLAMAEDMDKGVVVRESTDGTPIRTAVVDREMAMSLSLRDWIQLQKKGRVSRYRITNAGTMALKRMLSEDKDQSFADQHRVWGERVDVDGTGMREKVQRVNLAESPLALLARRKDKSGNRFLSDDLVCAGERLREDFELAQMGPSVTQNWERFLSGPGTGGALSDGKGGGSSAARDRLQRALGELGPGLGDVALRCCCYLEGLETAEKKMGWAARSGKIVLRIALQRLKRHYDELHGRGGPMIG